jgi:hypothetical protein
LIEIVEVITEKKMKMGKVDGQNMIRETDSGEQKLGKAIATE